MPRLNSVDPLRVTAGLTAIAYAVVIATFVDALPIYPSLTSTEIDLFSHAIAVVNTLTIVTILAGVYCIRHRRIRAHAAAMATSVGLILLFLVLYLWKIGGGGTKEIAGDPHMLVYYAYLAMLAIHIVLSIIAVPLVLYVLLLALTTPIERIGQTRHPTIGRWAAGVWLVSLILGVITYVILNHVYEPTLMLNGWW